MGWESYRTILHRDPVLGERLNGGGIYDDPSIVRTWPTEASGQGPNVKSVCVGGGPRSDSNPRRRNVFCGRSTNVLRPERFDMGIL